MDINLLNAQTPRMTKKITKRCLLVSISTVFLLCNIQDKSAPLIGSNVSDSGYSPVSRIHTNHSTINITHFHGM